MKNLNRKIGALALVGMMASGVFLSSSLSISHADNDHFAVLCDRVSPERIEDFKSIFNLNKGRYEVVSADPDVNFLGKLEDKGIKLQKKSIKYGDFIKELRKDGSLKDIGLDKQGYYLIDVKDDNSLGEEVDSLEVLIHVFKNKP